MPDRYFPEVVNVWTRYYINPAFNQGWTMFAPNPPTKEKWMEYRWASDGKWNEWHRADTLYERPYHLYRVTHHVKMHHIIQNSAAHLWGEAWKSTQMADKYYAEYEGDSLAYLYDSFGYLTCMHLTEKIIVNIHNVSKESIDSIDIRLILKDPFIMDDRAEIDSVYYEFPTKILDD